MWLVSEQPILEAYMAKTIALFFVLGLMVSCASYHNERSISSVDKHEKEAGYQERNFGPSY
jgi:hypothetical protein